jgi:hypothetical protein
MTYTHISWFKTEQLYTKHITKMCKYCGNDNPNKIECQGCDIGFENYVYTYD